MNLHVVKQIAVYAYLLSFVQSTATSDFPAGRFEKCVNVQQTCAARGAALGCTKCKSTHSTIWSRTSGYRAMVPPSIVV